MIVFTIVQETYGWAVRRDAQLMMPVSSRAMAVVEAKRMVAALHCNGDLAQLRFATELSLEQAA